jgi:hypothetical protein
VLAKYFRFQRCQWHRWNRFWRLLKRLSLRIRCHMQNKTKHMTVTVFLYHIVNSLIFFQDKISKRIWVVLLGLFKNLSVWRVCRSLRMVHRKAETVHLPQDFCDIVARYHAVPYIAANLVCSVHMCKLIRIHNLFGTSQFQINSRIQNL